MAPSGPTTVTQERWSSRTSSPSVPITKTRPSEAGTTCLTHAAQDLPQERSDAV